MPASLTDVVRVSADGDHAITVAGPLVVAVWRGIVAPAAVQRSVDAMQLVMENHPGDAVVIHVADAAAPIPGDEARRAFANLMRAAVPPLRCASVVGEGDGFATSVARTVVGGLTLLVRPKIPFKVFATPMEASVWTVRDRPLQSKLPARPEDLVSVIEVTRSLIRP